MVSRPGGGRLIRLSRRQQPTGPIRQRRHRRGRCRPVLRRRSSDEDTQPRHQFLSLPIQETHNIYDKRYAECGPTLPPNLVTMNRARQQKPRLRRSTPRPTRAGNRFQRAIFASKCAATVSAPSLIPLIVRHMTAWPDLVVGDLLGGISQVLGTPPPLTPAPNEPPAYPGTAPSAPPYPVCRGHRPAIRAHT